MFLNPLPKCYTVDCMAQVVGLYVFFVSLQGSVSVNPHILVCSLILFKRVIVKPQRLGIFHNSLHRIVARLSVNRNLSVCALILYMRVCLLILIFKHISFPETKG